MSSAIIPVNANRRLDLQHGESGELISQATPGVTTWVEYGRVAVGSDNAGNVSAPTGSTTKLNTPAAVDSSPLPSNSSAVSAGAYVQHWISNREVSSDSLDSNGLNTSLTGTRIIGFSRLKNLLQPKHPYFEDKYAEIKYWTRYLDTKNNVDMVYPRVKTYHRENPYRKYQLNRQSSSRAAKKIFKLIEQKHIKGARVTDLTLTMPGAMSLYLADKGKAGRLAAWNMETRFWQSMKDYGLIGEGHARRCNLHTWSSSEPLEPHFHFHELIPNWEQSGTTENVIDMPKYPCSDCGKTLWLKSVSGGYCCATCNDIEREPVFSTRQWKRNSKYTFVPFNEKELTLVKALWLNVLMNYVRQNCIDNAWDNQSKLLRFQRRHGITGLCRLISFKSRFGKGLVDIMVTFDKLTTDIGRAKFMHKIAYNGRHPIEDYAVYTNKHPECGNPAEFMAGYDNRAKLTGWWRDIQKIVDLSQKDEIQKLSPYTAEPMEYLGRYDNSELLDCQGGRLVAVDIIRGKPVERYISNEEKGWLELIEYKQYYSV